MRKILKIGVCEGRHEMPVDKFVFGQQVNPLDVIGLETQAEKRLLELKGNCNQLHLYVTGLTVAVIAVIKVALEMFDSVVLLHYNRDSNSYYQQIFQEKR